MSDFDIEAKIRKMEVSTQLSPNDWALIEQYSTDNDAYIRDLVAVLLAQHLNKQSEDILIRLTQDDDSLVRTDAYDSLSGYYSANVMSVLKTAVFNEQDYLARSYAIRSYADVVFLSQNKQLHDITFFQELLANETSELCKLSCYYALHIGGNKYAVEKILSFLYHPDYHIRCSAISVLSVIVDPQNVVMIRNAVIARERTEDTFAAKCSMKEFLEYSNCFEL